MARMQRGRKKNQIKAKKKKSKPNFKPTDSVERISDSSNDEDAEPPTVEEQSEMVEEAVDPLRHPSGQPVFFTELPDKFCLVNAALYAKSPLPFAQCDVCSAYSVRAVVSSCGHKFCENCVRLSQVGRGVFCHYCRKQFPFELQEGSDELLDQTIVQCRCGFEGIIKEVRMHIAYRGGKCQDSTQPLLNVLAADRSAMKTAKWRRRCRYLFADSSFYRKDVKPPENFDEFFAECPRNPKMPHVYIDLNADGIFIGRLYVELRPDVVPHTVVRFLELIKDANGYKGSEVDLMMDDTFFRVQRVSKPGYASNTVYPDENFKLKHDKAGTLSMANHGPNTSNDAFYISNKPMPWRDGINVVFGYVIFGIEVVSQICDLGRDDGTICRRVQIFDCGLINEWMLPSIFGDSNLLDGSQTKDK